MLAGGTLAAARSRSTWIRSSRPFARAVARGDTCRRPTSGGDGGEDAGAAAEVEDVELVLAVEVAHLGDKLRLLQHAEERAGAEVELGSGEGSGGCADDERAAEFSVVKDGVALEI